MTDEQLNWFVNLQNNLYKEDGADLCDIIYSTLSKDKMSYISFIKRASEGHGFSPSEGCGYALDQDWDNPEEFDEVSFMFGDYDSSTLSPKRFVELMQVISDAYIDAHPNDKRSVESYMIKLRERYSSFN
ncbi:hypothetical protein [Leminorella grimontii]|uniref:hypothetical protein n=1 Tax=Leminorella grimontii TaxID=82981 RepID=UPI00207F93A6|nr:hypothetical protein [Leminorella grimontii]GKX59196.1 hypothetical protein SOASR031_15110 [Leminorella grimontii]